MKNKEQKIEGKLTVIAHFCQGDVKYKFPSLENKVEWSEGDVFRSNIFPEDGGIIVASFGTNNLQLLIDAFQEDFRENDMTFLGIKKPNERSLSYIWTKEEIF